MVVVRGSAWRAAICTSRRGTPASSAAMMNPARSMCGWTTPRPARLPIERTHRCAVRRSKRCPSLRRRIGPSWRRQPPDRWSSRSEARAGSWPACSLANDAQRPVAALQREVVDVGPARLRDPQAVEAEQHGQRGVIAIETLGGEQERAQLGSVHAVTLARLDFGSAHRNATAASCASSNVSSSTPHTVVVVSSSVVIACTSMLVGGTANT